MATHELKIEPEWFERIEAKQKRVEIRKDDRDYQAGDYLVLREFRANPNYDHLGEYTHRAIDVLVTHALRDVPGLQLGYVALSVDAARSTYTYEAGDDA